MTKTERAVVVKDCMHCGALLPEGKHSKLKKYCNDKCSNGYNNEKRRRITDLEQSSLATIRKLRSESFKSKPDLNFTIQIMRGAFDMIEEFEVDYPA